MVFGHKVWYKLYKSGANVTCSFHPFKQNRFYCSKLLLPTIDINFAQPQSLPLITAPSGILFKNTEKNGREMV